MDYSVRNPESITTLGLASFPFARRYLGNRCFFLFLRLLRCFSSAGFPLHDYVFIIQWLCMTTAGFPHSEICGSMDICSFPQLIAAYHVLHRHLMPRHSPCALIRLNFPISDLSITWFSSFFLNCLSFIKTFFRLFLSLQLKDFPFVHWFFSTFRWNCIFLPYFLTERPILIS